MTRVPGAFAIALGMPLLLAGTLRVHAAEGPTARTQLPSGATVTATYVGPPPPAGAVLSFSGGTLAARSLPMNGAVTIRVSQVGTIPDGNSVVQLLSPSGASFSPGRGELTVPVNALGTSQTGQSPQLRITDTRTDAIDSFRIDAQNLSGGSTSGSGDTTGGGAAGGGGGSDATSGGGGQRNTAGQAGASPGTGSGGQNSGAAGGPGQSPGASSGQNSGTRPLVPCVGGEPCTLTQLKELGANIFNFLMAVGAVAAIAAIIVAGFQYITSRGDPGAMAEAKKKLTLAIMGLLILLGSVVIVNTILRVLGFKVESTQKVEDIQ
jgi:type IV secretion system pilin